MAKRKRTAPESLRLAEVEPGLCRIRLSVPWGDRPAGEVVVVDGVRAEQMIAAGAAGEE